MPDFTQVLQHIILQTYVLPNLPPHLYQLAYPKKYLSPLPPMPGSAATSVTGSTGAISSAGSAISGLTLPTIPGSSTLPGTTGRGAQIINLHPIPSIVSLVSTAAKLKDIIGMTDPLKFDNGTEMSC
jgi:hypothetical protein